MIPLHKILLNSAELSLIDADDCFLLRFTDPFGPTECHLSKDGARATFYCPPTSHSVMQEKLFHCIRFTYLLLAQKRGLFMLHSASLLYRDRAWLFSGHSGAGKSTHTNMWKEHLNTPLLNGDLNLIELRSDGPVVHGIPWCGTSGISTTKSYPLGGIILLRQHCQDLCEKPASDKQTLLVMHRLISPAWTAEMLRTNLSFCDKLTKQIFVSRLFCTKSFSAVDLIQKEIDQYTEGILP